MNNICSRCNGTGYEEYDEDYAQVYDSCYHCGETGYVSDESAWQDELAKVASTLAYYHVSEMRGYYNSNPDGEGWDFCAAENMMTGSDYFRAKCWEYESVFINQLMELTVETQKVLVAWQKFNDDEEMNRLYYRDDLHHPANLNIPKDSDTIPHNHMAVWSPDNDNIPF